MVGPVGLWGARVSWELVVSGVVEHDDVDVPGSVDPDGEPLLDVCGPARTGDDHEVGGPGDERRVCGEQMGERAHNPARREEGDVYLWCQRGEARPPRTMRQHHRPGLGQPGVGAGQTRRQTEVTAEVGGTVHPIRRERRRQDLDTAFLEQRAKPGHREVVPGDEGGCLVLAEQAEDLTGRLLDGAAVGVAPY